MLLETNLGSASDENGYYNIENIPIGNYTLLAMFIGYENLEKEIKIDSDSTYTINLNLSPSSIKLQTTTVTAEKRKDKITGAPASIEIITTRDIKGKNTTNMGAYLKGLKGIDFTSSGINNYSISVRGFNSSFSTRLLTLSDGRIANIPALRVINYSTIPQSMDDVDKIEVILGPATALYGANAHSGVVNIVSKPPSKSEGLSMSFSGSNDERQLRKINGRFAKKLSNTISFKLSGLYLHAYDWPFISEEEYKSHLYPWSLTPGRTSDGKDNNPWNTRGGTLIEKINNSGETVRIGNGEANHGDLDGDGVAGEDWYNGIDDDGDGLIDEDYFTADGIDNDQDGLIDEDIDLAIDFALDGADNDNNGIIDDEAGAAYLEASIKEWGGEIENGILISEGRRDSLIHENINPYYITRDKFTSTHDLNGNGIRDPNEPFLDYQGDLNGNGIRDDSNLYTEFILNTDPSNAGDGIFIDNSSYHLEGTHRYNEEKITLEFDIYTYDFGLDGLPGDPFIDSGGDGQFQVGECRHGYTPNNTWTDACDFGLDGIANTNDTGEGNGIWDPGDGWKDINGDGQVNASDDRYAYNFFNPADENNYDDVWPPPNGKWDPGEEIFDYGQDGLENTGDYGENDGLLAWDLYELDGKFDTGDNLYAFLGESFSDDNGNGIRDPNETYIDSNNDGLYNAPDIVDNYQKILDNNGDGMSDYPDFEIDNRKVEFRLDYDPNPNFNLTFQSGYSWTKTQQVTGTGRYIADGYEYRFYQLKARYKNWFSQYYINRSQSGDTRGYTLGNIIKDTSENSAFQLQNSFNINSLNTKFVWGLDYFRTAPQTYGTILNDGPNGYDNDGDNLYIKDDGIDSDNDGMIDDLICSDGIGEGFRNNKYWKCGEGIDEPDEFVDPLSKEYGVYFQSSTKLFGSPLYELVTAARLDYHDLLDEGVLFAPKVGFIYKPDSKSSMRFTYGKAYNTPNSITLFTDLYIGSVSLFSIYLRGNKDGTPYCRVGTPCLGTDYPNNITGPGFYSEDGSTFINMGTANNPNYFDNYGERVSGAPYFFKFPEDQSIISGDMMPLDTAHFLIFVPELNDDGVLYSAEESINIGDVEPIKAEKIQTLEFGYKGFINKKTHLSIDYYLSYYEDFFSPPTFITPWVVKRLFDSDGNDITNTDNIDIQGIMTINSYGTNPPYGTAFNGLDDDNDWHLYASAFGWDLDDKDGNCPENASTAHECWADPGEWGFVLDDGTIYHPHEALNQEDGLPTWDYNSSGGEILDNLDGHYNAVGIDEWHETTGLAEFEPVQTGLIDGDGNPIIGWGNADSPYHIVLSPMNYGKVWMQGIDIGLTHFISQNLLLDGNLSWYGTTEFYNELTKKNDPINAPEWKWNASIKWNSKFGDIILNYRHVNSFEWKDGIWAGIIGPYDIIDLFYTYHITDGIDLNLSALNINNDRHKELIGGATMGRQIVMRLTATF